MKKLILASASPRRRELLGQLNVPFEVIPSRYEEHAEGLPAREAVLRLAEGKAAEVFSRCPDCAVLGADTVVALDGAVLGKPRSAEDAKRTLRALSGREHSVFTGVSLLAEGFRRTVAVESRVRFFPLSEQLIERYVASGLPMDKAGSYGIQDGYPLVERYEGSYENIVGLPVEAVRALLKEGKIC